MIGEKIQLFKLNIIKVQTETKNINFEKLIS